MSRDVFLLNPLCDEASSNNGFPREVQGERSDEPSGDGFI